jgi:arsenate reductase-like glutaredoxin family protein
MLKLKRELSKREKPKYMSSKKGIYKIDPITGELTQAVITGDEEKKLSDDPKSEASKKAQERLKKAGVQLDLSDFSEKRLDKSEKSLLRKAVTPLQEKREERLTKDQFWRMSEKDEVTDNQLKQIDISDKALFDIERIEKLLAKGVAPDKYPKAGRILRDLGAEWFGMEKGEWGKLQNLSEKQLADYVRSMSGLTVTDKEAERLAKQVPTMDQPLGDFKRNLELFKEGLTNARKVLFKNLSGYQTKDLKAGVIYRREMLIRQVKKRHTKASRAKIIRSLKEAGKW